MKIIEYYLVTPIGRARAYHFRDGLLFGDALFEFDGVHFREALRPFFFVIRILFAHQNGIPFQKCIWPAGLLKIEPEIEREIADLYMRSIAWDDIRRDQPMRCLAMASAAYSSLSETGLYMVDAEKVTGGTQGDDLAPRFKEHFREVTKNLFGHSGDAVMSEALKRLVVHSFESLGSAA